MRAFVFFLSAFFICHSSRLHAQPYKEGYITVSGTDKLYYRLYGSKGDTLLLLHGGPGQNMYGISYDLIPLSKKHVVIMYDQRGCGRSVTNADSVSFEDHINDINAVRTHFKLEKVVLVGQSWGCMLATLYTSKFENHVKRMVFISPGPPTRKLFDERFATFRRIDSANQHRVALLRQQLTGSDPNGTCKEIHGINEVFYFFNDKKIKNKKGDYCEVPAEALRMQARTGGTTLRSLGNYDLAVAAINISIPVLIIEGKQSPVPIAELHYWKQILPTAKIYLYHKSGHGYPFVEKKRLFFSDVFGFLGSKWPARKVF